MILSENDGVMANLVPGVIKAEANRRFSGELAVSVFDSIGSTNTWLTNQIKGAPLHSGQAVVCVAEHQTAGRGRRGKAWHSPDRGVTFSTAVNIPLPAAALSGLSLLCGAAVCDSMRAFGVVDAKVKWPNDIYIGDAKLAGVLIEVIAAKAQSSTIITGIGVNYLRGREAVLIDQQSTDLNAACDGNLPDRSLLIGCLIGAQLNAYSGNINQSVEQLSAQWEQYDALRDKVIKCDADGGGEIIGKSVGIDRTGRLLVKTSDAVAEITAGSVLIQR